MKRELSENLYRKEWETIQHEKNQPRFLRNIISSPYSEFREKILEQDPEFVRTIVKSLHSGDVYILKQSFSEAFIRNLTVTLHQYGKKTPSSFHKIIDECPNFHRMITPELTKNYTLRGIKHAYYFFPWNEEPFNLFQTANEPWRIFKFLGGHPKDVYENNVPSAGIVDRLQIAHYPSGVGELELHSDPYLIQKIAIAGIMSKRGEDYKTGGAFILNKNKEKINIEDDMDRGDIYIMYPTVFHGVETIDRNTKANWNLIAGRWFMGLYSIPSDINQERHTCYGVESTINSGITKIQHPH